MRIGVWHGLSINLDAPYGPHQAVRIAPSPLSGKVGMVVNSEKIIRFWATHAVLCSHFQRRGLLEDRRPQYNHLYSSRRTIPMTLQLRDFKVRNRPVMSGRELSDDLPDQFKANLRDGATRDWRGVGANRPLPKGALT